MFSRRNCWNLGCSGMILPNGCSRIYTQPRATISRSRSMVRATNKSPSVAEGDQLCPSGSLTFLPVEYRDIQLKLEQTGARSTMLQQRTLHTWRASNRKPATDKMSCKLEIADIVRQRFERPPMISHSLYGAASHNLPETLNESTKQLGDRCRRFSIRTCGGRD